MGVNASIDVQTKDLKILRNLLNKYLPNTQVWAFGSRVKWTSRTDSDLDLVVFSTAEQNRQVHDLIEAMQESSLPFRVDVMVWDKIPDSFRDNIKQQYFVLVGKIATDVAEVNVYAADWPVLPLRELTINHDTKRKPVKGPDRKSGPYPYYGASGIVDYVDGYLFDGDYLLIAEDGENLRTRQTPIAFMAKGKFWVNNHAHIVTGNEQANTRFLMYALLNADVHSFLTGAVMPKLTQGNLNNIPIACPPREIQEAIVGFLGALDDRIALLRKANTTLVAIAQALFKSWFVDFDPVHAKHQGREPEGMDSDTAALFPASFEESELGLIPSGWHVLSFADTVKIIGGGTPKTSIPEYWDGDIPWFSVVDAPTITDVFVIDTAKHISEQGLNKSSTKLLPEGTTIISARGTVGRLALVGREMAMNQSCYGLRGKADDAYFTYFSTYRLVESLKQRSHGSVFDTITTETMKGVFVVYPDVKAIHAFETVLSPVMARIKTNLEQAQTLATLRDTLLPRLISGQLRLPEAVGRVSLQGVTRQIEANMSDNA